MPDELTRALSDMHRPRLLVRAARLAAAGRKTRKRKAGPLDRTAAGKLIAQEALLNAARKRGDAGYCPTRHVETLTALLSAASI